MTTVRRLAAVLCLPCACMAESGLRGQVIDPQRKAAPLAEVRLAAHRGGLIRETRTDGQGRFAFEGIEEGEYEVTVSGAGFRVVRQTVTLAKGETADIEVRLAELAGRKETVVITAQAVEPAIDLRNAEVFTRTLFSRDDQALQQLNAGIDAGQHEGGGKSLEIRRFGFNLDHGGVNGGLKILVDNVQQNQGTQGHGQGYLGALKAVTPELIEEVTMINGPFSAEYGDFSGLGVVHIRQRESLPDEITARIEGGNFNTRRGFLAYGPAVEGVDSYAAYEGSYTDGPFENPGRYRRDNVNANFTKALPANQRVGVRLLFGRNDFYSSGQIPLDMVAAGSLDRFGFLDPTDGGRSKLGSVSVYYSKGLANGDSFKADAFAGRSLLDVYSNFTFFLNDPARGDAFQQHDSRLQEGANTQYSHLHKLGGAAAILSAGANYHDSQVNVGLYPVEGRVPAGITTRADARITNGAGYAQESVSLFGARLILSGGLRYDGFRFRVKDLAAPERSGTQMSGRWQPKASAAYTPSRAVPLTLHANYGRGINSVDARGAVEQPGSPRLAATDFYEVGASSRFGRFAISADSFLIDHSHEMVYIPDDGSFELKGPSRAYGYEAKASLELTRHASLNGGLTKIGNAFFKGGENRVYEDSAPHFVANAALTVAGWRGWSGSLRMRAINHYRLDGEDAGIAASGHTVFDLGIAKQIRRGVELNVSIDNLTNRDYWETQNYFVSRVAPGGEAVARIHATPAYPLTAMVGLTFRLSGK